MRLTQDSYLCRDIFSEVYVVCRAKNLFGFYGLYADDQVVFPPDVTGSFIVVRSGKRLYPVEPLTTKACSLMQKDVNR